MLAVCSLAICGLQTCPRTDEDPPRVELPSAGAYRLAAPAGAGDNLLRMCSVSWCVYREFNRLLDSYVSSVSRGSITPAPGRSVRDDLLNNDRNYVTVFVPTNAATVRSTAYEKERYRALQQGFDPNLLQKVTTVHCESKKTRHFTTVRNFAKC